MLAGEGADRFAKSQGLEIVDNMILLLLRH